MAKIASYEEFVSDTLADKITDYKNPSCTSCNECCSMGAMLTKKEFNEIRKYLKTTPNGKQLMKQAKNLLDYHKSQGNIYWVCPLSTKSKRCGIYHIRPKVCREFHCSPSLARGYNRDEIEKECEYMIFDLFQNR